MTEPRTDFCFCSQCGSWLAPAEGDITVGDNGVEIVCESCKALADGSACAPEPGSRSGQILNEPSTPVNNVPTRD